MKTKMILVGAALFLSQAAHAQFKNLANFGAAENTIERDTVRIINPETHLLMNENDKEFLTAREFAESQTQGLAQTGDNFAASIIWPISSRPDLSYVIKAEDGSLYRGIIELPTYKNATVQAKLPIFGATKELAPFAKVGMDITVGKKNAHETFDFAIYTSEEGTNFRQTKGSTYSEAANNRENYSAGQVIQDVKNEQGVLSIKLGRTFSQATTDQKIALKDLGVTRGEILDYQLPPDGSRVTMQVYNEVKKRVEQYEISLWGADGKPIKGTINKYNVRSYGQLEPEQVKALKLYAYHDLIRPAAARTDAAADESQINVIDTSK